MVIAGATDTAIYVEPLGRLSIYDSVFQNNSAGSGSGGAIFVSNKSILQIRFSRFEGNHAEIGGAIFSLGESKVANSDFYGNLAATAVSVSTEL
jgi:predicted outer membrane repeat protein